MIPGENPPPETETPSPLLEPGNDDGSAAAVPIDPRILVIARAIGRQIARDLDTLPVANDNESTQKS